MTNKLELEMEMKEFWNMVFGISVIVGGIGAIIEIWTQSGFGIKIVGTAIVVAILSLIMYLPHYEGDE